MPARSRSSELSRLARTRSVRVSAPIRLSSVATSPSSAQRRAATAARAETGMPTADLADEALGDAEVDEDAASGRRGSRPRSRCRPGRRASTAEDADPAVEGRADHPALERELGVAQRELGLAHGELGLEQLHLADRPRADQLLVRARAVVAGVVERQPRPVERDALGVGVEPDDRLRRRATKSPGRDLDRGDPPGDVGRHRHRAGGAAVADRRSPSR